ncbi:DNA polymerase iota [Melopsittacus undulatus]|uniref:DNA polymerase iota n=2 Tax=Melopsittacus undulatus TaxID=13146 RepID=UPI00146F60E1|nr:DNA polymerase iota [Melopsittacus undulatus]XP_033929953.1 DNA polymerase iota [Melopsittacus undulatus]XP_033929954.1 DNA polymerase iota [Melopsittacus undulatus]XP_033929955.1 DNA polymerase iota [Melopsittacus undulatus]XP_033929956.1 DNA polymerase iota [Melopsittacus undulatus]XP_033929957.1 DNA polymerase iota [Melopsittacus undulatus]XP_033929958.1 DNA polymerase iota [Melopsittacus undulatus]XP_033929959.1 DNA polymerase iota [Melopsittacus undulatus]XP_033929960.1 DNA polymera
MLRAPELRDKALGVQQKSLVVTCNYEARRHGVKKLMSLKEATEKCPHLVLVNGEDLTPYREMSYKVTELLREYCPLVERLGLDENFLDITDVVEQRIGCFHPSGWAGIRVSGHVYKDQAINVQDPTHRKLAIGSQVMEELRECLYSTLGLTSSAGVATTKFLAKVVSGTFKPNQQTLLLPHSTQELLRNLGSIRKVPGIGSRTAERLEALGVKTVVDLQRFPSAGLEKELGIALAQRIRKLGYGQDEAPVTPSGPPQSFSDEDSFRKCSSEAEVQEKLGTMLPSLLERIRRDGRQPRTIRLSIRRFSSSGKGFHRECRQCPIPPHLLPKFGKDPGSLLSPLGSILMKLLRKMIPTELPFHLTLLNVCFSNLQELPTRKGSIGFYLKGKGPAPASGQGGSGKEAADSQGKGSASCSGIPNSRKLLEGEESPRRPGTIPSFPPIAQEVLPEALKQELPSQLEFQAGNVPAQPSLPFPKEIPNPSQNPMGLSSAVRPAGCTNPVGATQAFEYPSRTGVRMEKEPPEAGIILTGSCASSWDKEAPAAASMEQTHCKDVVIPPDVDKETFYELPVDVQRELLAQWKSGSQRTDKPLGKLKARKRRRMEVPCGSNSLWRYLKPREEGFGRREAALGSALHLEWGGSKEDAPTPAIPFPKRP